MSFFGDLLNSIPVVGHVKGIIHYVCDDEEGGDRAMRVATRSAAVVGAATVGALAGPGGAVAAGIAAGAAYDTGTAIVTDGRQVSGVAKILTEPGEISSWVGAGVDIAFDGLAGVGGAGGGLTNNLGKEAGKKMAKQSIKQVVRTEGEMLAERMAAIALNAAYNSSKESANGGRRPNSTADDSSKRHKTNGGAGNRGAKDADKGTSGDPGDRRDGSEEKKKECQGATIQQLREFIRIVEAMGEFMTFMMRLGSFTARCLRTINRYLQEFIAAAIPLMNDPNKTTPTFKINLCGC